MLPFLRPKAQVGITVKTRPSDSDDTQMDESSDSEGLESAMEDLCHALDAKDYRRAADAFKAAFDMLESQPHEEVPHTEGEES